MMIIIQNIQGKKKRKVNATSSNTFTLNPLVFGMPSLPPRFGVELFLQCKPEAAERAPLGNINRRMSQSKYIPLSNIK